MVFCDTASFKNCAIEWIFAPFDEGFPAAIEDMDIWQESDACWDEETIEHFIKDARSRLRVWVQRRVKADGVDVPDVYMDPARKLPGSEAGLMEMAKERKTGS